MQHSKDLDSVSALACEPGTKSEKDSSETSPFARAGLHPSVRNFIIRHIQKRIHNQERVCTSGHEQRAQPDIFKHKQQGCSLNYFLQRRYSQHDCTDDSADCHANTSRTVRLVLARRNGAAETAACGLGSVSVGRVGVARGGTVRWVGGRRGGTITGRT